MDPIAAPSSSAPLIVIPLPQQAQDRLVEQFSGLAVRALVVLGALWLLLSLLAASLPPHWRFTQMCGRLSADIRGVAVRVAGGRGAQTVLLFALVALAPMGCSLQGARLAGRPAQAAADPALTDPVCDAIDREHGWATVIMGIGGGVATAAGAAAAGAGQIHDEGARNTVEDVAAVTGVAAGAVGLAGGAWQAERAARWARRCAP